MNKNLSKTINVSPKFVDLIPATRTGQDMRMALILEKIEYLNRIYGYVDAGYAGQMLNLIIDKYANRKPYLGTFLLIGPAGSGKTSFSKLFTSFLDTTESLHSSINMASLQHRSDADAIFGAKPGYLGFLSEGTKLLNSLKKNNALIKERDDTRYEYEKKTRELPKMPLIQVVEFDMVDRCNPDVLDACSNIIINGTMTDTNTDQIQLLNSIIIMTATASHNLSQELVEIGNDQEKIKNKMASMRDIQTGARKFRDDILSSCTIIPFSYPNPQELMTTTTLRIGLELAKKHPQNEVDRSWAHSGRLRIDPEFASYIINQVNVPDLMSGGFKNFYSKLNQEIEINLKCNQKSIERVVSKDCFIVGRNGSDLVFKPIDKATVKEQYESMTGSVSLPLNYLESFTDDVGRDSYWSDIESIELLVANKVAGQELIVKDICDGLRKGLLSQKGRKPIWSSIIVGPTGTGKTLICKSLAEAAGKNLVFFDCNTWKDELTVKKSLFGEGEDSLFNEISVHRDSIVVFDEIDKANQKIWEYLMTILDTGDLIDSNEGKKISLRHACVVMTSNYLSDQLSHLSLQLKGKDVSEMDRQTRLVLKHAAGISEPCLERLDRAYLMGYPEGKALVSVWEKLILSKLFENNNTEHIRDIDSDVISYIDYLHLNMGGTQAARSRIRTIDSILVEWHKSEFKDPFVMSPGRISINQTKQTLMITNPRPKSERERFWGLSDEKINKLKNLYKGNDEILDCVIDSLQSQGRKVSPREPAGVVLMVGPTGSGKTYLGQILATVMDKGEPIRIDGQLLAEDHSINSILFGAPSEYKGSENGGMLTKQLMIRKDRVVIFDEVERAHPTFIDKIMNVLDEGVAVDRGTHLPVDLKQCYFVMTSNLVAGEDADKIKAMNLDPEAEAVEVSKVLIKKGVKPEHLARINSIYLVMPPSHEKQDNENLHALINQIMSEYGHNNVTIKEEAMSKIHKYIKTVDPLLGQRAVRRALNKILYVAISKNEGMVTFNAETSVIQ